MSAIVRKWEKRTCYACGRVNVDVPVKYRDNTEFHVGVCGVCAPYLHVLEGEILGRAKWEINNINHLGGVFSFAKQFVGKAKENDEKSLVAMGISSEMIADVLSNPGLLSALLIGKTDEQRVSIFRVLIKERKIDSYYLPLEKVESVSNEDLMEVEEQDEDFFGHNKSLFHSYRSVTANAISRKCDQASRNLNRDECRKLYEQAVELGYTFMRKRFVDIFHNLRDRRYEALADSFSFPPEKESVSE